VPLVAQGNVTGLLAAVRSPDQQSTPDDEWLLSALADQTAVALENARLNEAVQRAHDDRERSAEAQGHAHATLGHELKSPLSAILSYCSLLLEGLFGPLTDRQRESLGRIRMSGRHVLSIIDNVLDVARLNAGAIQLESSDVPVAEVLDEALQMFQPLAHEKQQKLRRGPIEPMIVRADATRLRQALVNLIGNAVNVRAAEPCRLRSPPPRSGAGRRQALPSRTPAQASRRPYSPSSLSPTTAAGQVPSPAWDWVCS
jgi:two-component system cell cycle sensor histidine kinase PleC